MVIKKCPLIALGVYKYFGIQKAAPEKHSLLLMPVFFGTCPRSGMICAINPDVMTGVFNRIRVIEQSLSGCKTDEGFEQQPPTVFPYSCL